MACHLSGLIAGFAHPGVRAGPGLVALGEMAGRISHVIVTTCTGFSAPGLDLDMVSAVCPAPPSDAKASQSKGSK
jgi:hypothetical protein